MQETTILTPGKPLRTKTLGLYSSTLLLQVGAPPAFQSTRLQYCHVLSNCLWLHFASNSKDPTSSANNVTKAYMRELWLGSTVLQWKKEATLVSTCPRALTSPSPLKARILLPKLCVPYFYLREGSLFEIAGRLLIPLYIYTRQVVVL